MYCSTIAGDENLTMILLKGITSREFKQVATDFQPAVCLVNSNAINLCNQKGLGLRREQSEQNSSKQHGKQSREISVSGENERKGTGSPQNASGFSGKIQLFWPKNDTANMVTSCNFSSSVQVGPPV